MQTTPQTGTTPSTQQRPRPGNLLQQARTDLRLTQEEVAKRLHLATRQIQGLEEDDYSGLPGATYVRGYLRSYASLLGLDPETVLNAHTQLTAKPVISTDFSTITPQKQITSHHHQIRFVTYVVSIIVIGLAIAWWQSRNAILPSPIPLASTTTPATEASPADNTAVSASDPSMAGPATQTNMAAPAQPPAIKPVEPPVQPVVPVIATPVTPPVLPNAPRVHFVLHADQDAWVDIRDARQVKLLYETVAAGRSVPLEGVAPISIYLGNPAGTRIELDGAPVDIERHRRGLTARFTLGETAVPAR